MPQRQDLKMLFLCCQVQEGVLDALRIVIVTKPADSSAQVKTRLVKVGADLIHQVSRKRASMTKHIALAQASLCMLFVAM